MFKGVGKCVEQGKYSEAVFLFTLAGVYGRFDTLRVADESTHPIVMTLRVQALDAMAEDKKSAFVEVAKGLLGKPEGLGDICKQVVRLGPPNYYPGYMIKSAPGASTGDKPNGGLISNFDAADAWKKTLDVYLRC
jgi:hypothetical protein